MKKVKGFFNGIGNFIKKLFSTTKSSIATIAVIFVTVIIISGAVSNKQQVDERQKALDDAKKREQEESANTVDLSGFGGNDEQLMLAQSDLVKSYGAVPDGYIWDFDGTLLSLGDKNMTAEEVIYGYFNGVRSLDFSMAQKYSRNSSVVNTYLDYFNTNTTTDYYDSFLRNMYKQVLLSIQVTGISDVSIFASNKEVFTVQLKMLDLSDKDFWKKDEDEIFNNLYVYSSDESDSAKSEQYLYDYILSYYESGKASTRNVSVNLVVEKYPDLDTGWLISMDSDLNDACMYKDGKLVASYIQEQFNNYGRDYILNVRNSESSTENTTEATTEKSSQVEKNDL